MTLSTIQVEQLINDIARSNSRDLQFLIENQQTVVLVVNTKDHTMHYIYTFLCIIYIMTLHLCKSWSLQLSKYLCMVTHWPCINILIVVSFNFYIGVSVATMFIICFAHTKHYQHAGSMFYKNLQHFELLQRKALYRYASLVSISKNSGRNVTASSNSGAFLQYC